MAYNKTAVSVPKSQNAIRILILSNGGIGVAFVSQPPKEGFEAQIIIDKKTYNIRLTAECQQFENYKKTEQEERRVWRVLYHHLKAIFEAANTGVLEFREMILPYIVTANGMTLADHILPQLEKAISGHTKLLPERTWQQTE